MMREGFFTFGLADSMLYWRKQIGWGEAARRQCKGNSERKGIKEAGKLWSAERGRRGETAP